MTEIVVFPDSSEQARGVATRFVAQAVEVIAAQGRFSVALAGGSTPEPAYKLLASQACAHQVDWSRVHVFWGDERCVPPDHQDSNYRLAHQVLLQQIQIPDDNIHRIPGERGPEDGAQAYANELADHFESRWPTFDLALLGIGSDGHTASLFPGSDALAVTDRPVVGVLAEEARGELARITLTAPAINRANHIIFLVSGPEKAGVVHAVLQGPPNQLPAQWIQPYSGQLTWLLDRQAAKELEGPRWHWQQ